MELFWQAGYIPCLSAQQSETSGTSFHGYAMLAGLQSTCQLGTSKTRT